MMKKIEIVLIVIVLAGFTSCYYYGPCIDGTGPLTSETRELTGFTSVGNAGSFEVYVEQADSFFVEVVAQENLIPRVETYVAGSTLIIESDGSCFRTSSPIIVNISMPVINVLSLSGSGKIISDKIDGNNIEVVLSGSGQIIVDSIFSNHNILGNSGSGSVFVNYVDAVTCQGILSGSGSIDAGYLNDPDDVEIRHSSSGGIFMTIGNSSTVEALLSGSGRILLFGETDRADFINSASGRIDGIELQSRISSATVTGSGNIYTWVEDYLTATITGSGSIYYLGDPEIHAVVTGSGNLRRY